MTIILVIILRPKLNLLLMEKPLKQILSELFGATFPKDNTMKIVLPKGSLIEENTHTVSIEELPNGSVKIESGT